MSFGSANIPGVSAPDFKTHTDNRNNPHTVTKAQIGLGNVDNTADINKPVSTAVQTALNGKAAVSHTHAANHITQDSSHRFVTDSEKTVWNLKSNPNLLDNWYFADPINQRGITTMTTHFVYAIDRFIFQNASGAGSLTVNTDSITLTAKDNDGLAQFTESHFTAGENYTMSLLTKDGQLLTATGMCTEGGALYDYPRTYWKWLIDKTRCYPILIYEQSSPVSLTLVAAKLEKGTQQTLARKEGSRWVLNDPPPNKALELSKCQYYFMCQSTQTVFVGEALAIDIVSIVIPLAQTMRRTPSAGVTFLGAVFQNNNSWLLPSTTITNVTMNPSSVQVDIQIKDVTFTPGAPVVIRNGQFILSAE